MTDIKQEPKQLPKDIKLVGMYKLKDIKERDLISFPIGPEVEGIIIQKVRGVNNKILVLVKLYDKEKLDEASRKLQVLTDIENKNLKENKTDEENIKS